MSKKEKDSKPQLITAFFEDEMKTSYLNYAYSVITSRAIPDVRDGTKPVHRRILFAMSELALWHDKQTRKSARVVGDVLGKYHPHGDSSVYMAAVKMAQDFSMRYPLVVGQGNFGSIDDDPPAAMRYTEMKLSRVAEFMLDDIKKNTVDFRPNFDDTMKEPSVLPGKFPQLLCNGTSGIAVGFATDIPPHNLTEVSKAVAAYIKNPKLSVKEIMQYIQGPDFPTHGVITNKQDLLEAYETGHGSVELAGKMEYEEKGSLRSIIITEIPYRIVKSKIVEEISNLALDNKSKYNLILKEIKEVRDESSKDGIRVNIVLTKDADEHAIKTIIYKATSMKVRVRMNFVNLVKNQPRVLNLRDMLGHYVEHRRDVIIRRTQFDLDKAEKELHILEGLLIALDNIDEVIRIIKASKDAPIARTNLMKAFKLSEIQAQAILDMRLQKLTNLETTKLIERKNELVKIITELKSILNSGTKRDKIIVDELAEMIQELGDERRTQFGSIDTSAINQEELIKNEAMLLTVSKKGFLIREIGSSLKAGSRKSKGRKGDATDSDRLEQDDYIFATVSGNLKDTVLFVSDAGRVYSLKAYEITGSNDGKITRGHIRNIERLKSIERNGEKISAVLLIDEFHEDCNMVFVTAKGKAPRIGLNNFSSVQRVGINAVRINEGDYVTGAEVTDGKQELFFLKKNGKGFRINESLLPHYSRGAAGANCVSTTGDDKELVLGMGTVNKEEFVLVITSDGKGKKLTYKNFTLRANRGGKGFKVIDIGKKRALADMTVCKAGDNIVITTKHGRRVSYSVDSLSKNLLKMIDLNDDDEVSALSTIRGLEEEIKE